MKQQIIIHLEKDGYEVCDFGTDSDEIVDLCLTTPNERGRHQGLINKIPL
ncbi:MAG: RpiB/LacA/LacB family sugar-phosphate isomerase [Bacteroidetes bacterium]|nr:RpiB/LacA/LacB family sugar-phosphate isomerase [Bacteroidota bacterium]